MKYISLVNQKVSKIFKLIPFFFNWSQFKQKKNNFSSNNGFFTIQYAFADSMQYCDDFMHFGEIGVKEIPEVNFWKIFERMSKDVTVLNIDEFVYEQKFYPSLSGK